MRILLAIDGSAAAGRARDLVDHLDWPTDSLIRIVAVLGRASDLVGLPGLEPTDARDIETSLARQLQDALDTAVLQLERPGRSVERILLRGRAASAIVDEAGDMQADLVVVGNRGHGAIGPMLLGSVSAEVVDHATCPVLVARCDEVGSILLAMDGSPTSLHAERTLIDWPVFRGRAVRVVTVAEVGIPWSVGMAPGIYDQVLESYTSTVDEARLQCQRFAESSAERLVAAGYDATAEVREGSSAAELVEAATARHCDLMVVGTRGHTGLTRLLLGSVARNVLIHAPSSVLVVREKARVEPVEEGAEAGSAGGG